METPKGPSIPEKDFQPFEELTKPRWDFHTHPVRRNGRWASDCSHWCFSPRFYDRSFHDLYQALAARLTPYDPSESVRARVLRRFAAASPHGSAAGRG